MASADEKPWGVDRAARVYGLQVILLKRVYVLPWSQFLYAEGTSEEMRAFFTTHDVVITGSDLDSLFADFACQQISILREPARTDRFSHLSGPRILGVQVRPVAATVSD
jgi:hypothetical protein